MQEGVVQGLEGLIGDHAVVEAHEDGELPTMEALVRPLAKSLHTQSALCKRRAEKTDSSYTQLQRPCKYMD